MQPFHKQIEMALLDAKKKDLRNFASSQSWSLTDLQIDRIFSSEVKNSGLLNIYGAFQTLQFYIKNSAGNYEMLQNYTTRDEIKIFFLVSLLESLEKLSFNTKGSRKAVGNFLTKYFCQLDKKRIQNSIKIQLIGKKSLRAVTFDEFAQILYGIRSSYAHEVNYVHQFFSKEGDPYKYRNCLSIKDRNEESYIENIETGLKYIEFSSMVSRAVCSWLIS